MEPRAGLPSFYASGIAKILSGEQPCKLESWVKGHLVMPKRPRSETMAAWVVAHTAMLTDEVDRLKAEGWKCLVERFFRLQGTTAILTGKPDVVCQAKDRRPKIVDTKSGRPKDSDVVQVQIYMIALPLAWESPGMIFDGKVVYGDHRVPVSPASAEGVKAPLFELLRQLGGSDRPSATPSEQSCRFCDVPDEACAERFKGSTPDVLVSEF